MPLDKLARKNKNAFVLKVSTNAYSLYKPHRMYFKKKIACALRARAAAPQVYIEACPHALCKKKQIKNSVRCILKHVRTRCVEKKQAHARVY